MGRVNKYPDELRERAVRMVAEVRPQYASQWAAITVVAGIMGIGTPSIGPSPDFFAECRPSPQPAAHQQNRA